MVYRSTARSSYRQALQEHSQEGEEMGFEVTLADETTEWVEGADSYQLEGPMTTFFGNEARRSALDCWSVKLASYRTDQIMRILRRL